jgi:hypothetical protein
MRECLSCGLGLYGEREANFLFDMTRWRGEPTEKQMNWLEELHDRFRATAP